MEVNNSAYMSCNLWNKNFLTFSQMRANMTTEEECYR